MWGSWRSPGLLKCEHASAVWSEGSLLEVTWGRRRTAGTLQAGLADWTLLCLLLQGMFSVLGTWVFCCFSSSCSFQSEKNNSQLCWKNPVLPIFSTEIYTPSAVLCSFPRRAQNARLKQHGTFSRYQTTAMWDCLIVFSFVVKDIKCYWYYVWISSSCNARF